MPLRELSTVLDGTPGVSPLRARAEVAGAVAVVLGVCAAAASVAERVLLTESIPLGPLTLRLLFNEGVAFGLGAAAPRLVLVLTSLVVLAMAVAAWRIAPSARRLQRAGGALVIGGGLANLSDRAADGRVTDYLSVGWWPTFNLPDTAIFLGAAVVLLTSWRSDPEPPTEQAP